MTIGLRVDNKLLYKTYLFRNATHNKRLGLANTVRKF